MSDPYILYPLLIGSALIAGVMNSIAGGGTLLTFPALLAVLGPEAAALANATSTVALLPGSLAGTWGYRRELKEVLSTAKSLLPVSFVGGLIGSILLVQFPKEFGQLVPWLILAAAVLFLIQPLVSRFLKKHEHDAQPPMGWGKYLLLQGFQFLVAVYGGYFGAGIGILMLAALGFLNIGNIHRMNAVKTLLAATINGITVVICIGYGLINWPYAIVMAIAAVIGGYLGARVARKLPPWVIRWTVIAIGFRMAIYAFANRN
jgi:uncharacterized protein